MPLRRLIQHYFNNEQFVQKLADNPVVRQAARATASVYLRGKDFFLQTKENYEDVLAKQGIKSPFAVPKENTKTSNIPFQGAAKSAADTQQDSLKYHDTERARLEAALGEMRRKLNESQQKQQPPPAAGFKPASFNKR